jgi:hypothetical protein
LRGGQKWWAKMVDLESPATNSVDGFSHTKALYATWNPSNRGVLYVRETDDENAPLIH